MAAYFWFRTLGWRRSSDRSPAEEVAVLHVPPLALLAAVALPVQFPDPDADRDGLSDFREVHKHRTDPRKADTDVGTLTLVWLPFRRDASGASAYAFSIV